MKRFFIWITAVVMALSCVTVAFAAGYSKLDNLTPGQVGYVLGQLLTEKTGNYVYDVPWYADSYDYRVIVSYDSLSELCSTANGLGMTCSVRWNHNAKLYVISVDDYTTFELSSTHGVIGNPDGYIYAAYDESEQGIWNNYGIGQWGVYADYSSTSVFREVSYATLSELCANLNEKGIPCYIASTSAWGSSTYWYIRGSGTVVYQQRYDAPSTSYSITNHVYLDIAAAPLVARYNPESTLSSCLSRLTSIQTNVTTIKNNIVNTISSNLDSLLTTCNTISTKLDTLTSVISNGKVLVDNSDVVSAIQSIPAFDDTEITGYVGSITEWLNLFSRKYDGNYTNMLQQVTFLNESLGQLRKHVITGNRYTSEIIDILTNAVDSDTGKLLVADTAVTSAIADLTDSLSIPAPTDYTSQLTAVVEKLDALANKPAVDLTTIESTLSTISDKLDNTASDVNNTIINITNDNDYFSVFYITDGDGNTQSVTDFAGALTGASGKLLSLLYRLVFADALGSVDGDLGSIEDFFTSEEPPIETTALDGDTAPANEVIDVWAS